MKRLILRCAAAVAAVLSVAVGLVVADVNGRLPVASVAELAPADTVVIVQAKDLASLWKEFQGTPAYQDFAHSRTAYEISQEAGWKDMMSMVEERAKRVGLEPTADNILSFIGHDIAFGLRVDRATGHPAPFMLYRVDTPGLVAKLGAENPKALAKLLTERYFGAEGTVAGEHGGYTIYAHQKTRYALIEDVFVASPDPSVIFQAIDLAGKKGEGSLGQSAKFKDEVAKVQDHAVAVVWVDLEVTRDKALQKKVIAAAAPPEKAGKFSAVVFDRLNQILKPVPSLALGLRVPGGDPYQLTVTPSHATEALFQETPSYPLSGLMPEGNFIYFEARDLRGLAKQFRESKLYAHLAGMKWFQEIPNLIEEAIKRRREDAFPPLPPDGEPGSEPRAPEPAAAPPEPADLHSKFEVAVASRLADIAVAAVLSGDLAVGVDVPKEYKEGAPPIPTVTLAIRLPPALRVVEALVTGGMAEALAMESGGEPKPAFAVEPHGSCWVVNGVAPLPNDQLMGWGFTAIGDVLLVANDGDFVKATAAKAKPGYAPAPPAAVTKLEPGYSFLFHVNYDKYATFMKQLQKSLQPPAPGGEPGAPAGDDMGMKLFEAFNVQQNVAAAVYFKDGFQTFEVQSYSALKPGLDPAIERQLIGRDGDHRAWSVLPSSTFLHFSQKIDLEALWHYLKAQLTAEQLKQVQGAFEEAKKALGKDVEKELLPALGGELGLAIAGQRAEPGTGAPSIPAIAIFFHARNPKTLDDVLHRIADMVAQQAQGGPPPEPGAPPPPPARPSLVGKPGAGGATIQVLDLSKDGQDPLAQFGGLVQPSYAQLGDLLVISSSARFLDECAGVKAGSTPALAASPVMTRAFASVRRSSQSYFALDFGGLLDVVDWNAEIIASALSDALGDEPPMPPFPEKPEEYEAFEKKLEEREKLRAELAKKRVVQVKEVVQSMRFLDFWAQSGYSDGRAVRGLSVLKLKF